MAAVRFDKGTLTNQFFTDYWIVFQGFYQVEDTESYWEELAKKLVELSLIYKDVPEAEPTLLAFYQTKACQYNGDKSNIAIAIKKAMKRSNKGLFATVIDSIMEYAKGV